MKFTSGDAEFSSVGGLPTVGTPSQGELKSGMVADTSLGSNAGGCKSVGCNPAWLNSDQFNSGHGNRGGRLNATTVEAGWELKREIDLVRTASGASSEQHHFDATPTND